MSVTTGFPFNIGPLNNIQPFTYRDQTSHMAMLEKLRVYINDVLRPEFNDEMQRIIDEFQTGIANSETTVTNSLADWTARFDQFMVDVTAEIALLNDAAVGSLVDNEESAVSVALNKRYQTQFMTTAVGDGSDETATLNADFAAAAALGLTVVLDGAKTYGHAGELIIPANLRLTTNGAPFKKLVNNNVPIKIADGFTCDWLKVILTGGVSNDFGVWVNGNNVDIGFVTITTLTDDQVGANALFVGDTNSANTKRNINIRNINIVGFRSPFRFVNVINCNFSGGLIQNFVTAIYAQNFVGTVCENIEVKGLSPSATGGAGQNGVLVEALADRAVRSSIFRNITVDQASEHAFRVGGGFSTVDLRFEDCVATRPGCINYNAGTGVGSTGGAGFKALGLLGHEHIGLTYTNCVVEDGNILGNGVDNFTAFNMGFIRGLTMTDCKVRKNLNATSAMQGLIIFAVKNVDITNLRVTDCQRQALKMVKDISEVYPAPGIDNLQIRGGILETATSGIVITSEPTTAPFKDIYIDTVVSKGSGVAFRAENTTTVGEAVGSYTGCFAKFKYINSPIDNAVATGAPPINSVSSAWIHDYQGPVYGAFNNIASDGSLELNTVTGVRRAKKLGAWSVV